MEHNEVYKYIMYLKVIMGAMKYTVFLPLNAQFQKLNYQ